MFEGVVYGLMASPLETYFEASATPRPAFEMAPGVYNSGNRRGYVAIWRIVDGKLVLLGIDASIDGAPVHLSDVFSGRPPALVSEVNANWATGTMRAVTGRPLILDGMGFSARYEIELEISVHDGVVTKAKRVRFRRVSEGPLTWFVGGGDAGERLGPYCTSCLQREPDYVTTAKLLEVIAKEAEGHWLCNKCEGLFKAEPGGGAR